MSLVARIEDEPVRFVGAIQGTVAAAALTMHWVAGITIPAEVQAVWLGATAAWLSFVTRENVKPA